MTTEELIGTTDAAAMLAVSVRTVHRLVATHRLTPAHKIVGVTGAYLFRPADVQALAAQLGRAA